jgi:hypothetical protein
MTPGTKVVGAKICFIDCKEAGFLQEDLSLSSPLFLCFVGGGHFLFLADFWTTSPTVMLVSTQNKTITVNHLPASFFYEHTPFRGAAATRINLHYWRLNRG